MRFLLIHSPLLGPSVWSALASVLRERGHEARAPDLRPALGAGAEAYESIAERISALAGDGAVLVAHSGAGALVPSVQDAAGSRVKSVIFVDALMPHPGRSWFDTLPAAAADRLRALAADGFAPAWPDWLPSGMLGQLLPDPEVRAALVAEAPRTPLAFLEALAPNLEHWSDVIDGSYLQLSPAYVDEAGKAERLGWPVERLDGNHLSMMTQPGPVAAALLKSGT